MSPADALRALVGAERVGDLDPATTLALGTVLVEHPGAWPQVKQLAERWADRPRLWAVAARDLAGSVEELLDTADEGAAPAGARRRAKAALAYLERLEDPSAEDPASGSAELRDLARRVQNDDDDDAARLAELVLRHFDG